MQQQKDYYKILEVDEKATQPQIKEAYRKLAFQYHPDRNKNDKSATEKMKEINEAYSVLSDPQKRKQYESIRNQYGSSGHDRFRQSYKEEDIYRGSDMNRVFDDLAKSFGFRSAEEIFTDMYGSNYQGFEFRGPGGFSARGFFVFGFPGARRKSGGSHNSGKGQMSGNQGVFLPGLFGKIAGYALKKLTGLQIPEKGDDVHNVIYITQEQARRGSQMRYLFRKGGQPKDVVVKIPSGIRNGQQLRLRGMGTPGKDGGVSGDLYLKVKIQGSLSGKVKNFFNSLGL